MILSASPRDLRACAFSPSDFAICHLPFALYASPVPYLDNNATTQPTPAVCEAVANAMTDLWENPASIHRPGQRVRNAVELARADVAELLGVKARTITFTGSGTESIHLAIRGILARHDRPVLVTTAVEHSAIGELAAELEKHHNAEIRHLPLLPGGLVDLAAAGPVLEGAHLVSVQWVNNETGLVQPIEELGRLCKDAGVGLHSDATQLVGRAPIPGSAPEGRATQGTERRSAPEGRATLPVDLLTASAHKFHGPKGVGILYTRPGLGLRPLFPGSEELGRRGGTLNVPGILGTGAAAREAIDWLEHQAGENSKDTRGGGTSTRGGGFQPPEDSAATDPDLARLGQPDHQRWHGSPNRESRSTRLGEPDHQPTIAHLESLRNYLETSIVNACPGAVVNCVDSPRLWTTASIALPGLDAEALLILLSEKGLAASAGAACSSGSREPSKVLLAMGVSEREAHGTIRLSLSRFTDKSDITEAIEIVTAAACRLRGKD